MIYIDDEEKEVCDLALQMCLKDRIILSPDSKSEDVGAAEDQLQDLQTRFEQIFEDRPALFAVLEKKLRG